MVGPSDIIAAATAATKGTSTMKTGRTNRSLGGGDVWAVGEVFTVLGVREGGSGLGPEVMIGKIWVLCLVVMRMIFMMSEMVLLLARCGLIVRTMIVVSEMLLRFTSLVRGY